MGSGRGKAVAWTTVALGSAVLIAAAYAFRGLFYEEIDLWKLRSKDPREVSAAAERLADRKSARAISGLLEILQQEKDGTIGPFFDHLKRCLQGRHSRVVESLTVFLRGEKGSAQLRHWAARELLQRHRESKVAQEVLLGFLEHTHWISQEEFHLLEDAGADTVPALVHGLESGGWKGDLISWLEWIGPEAGAAIPGLRKLLEDPDDSIRIQAARALDQIGADREVLRPVLVDALARSRSKVTAWCSPETVAILGKDAAPILARHLMARETDERSFVLYVLRQVPDEQIRSLDLMLLRGALQHVIREPDLSNASEAASVLVRMGRREDAQALVPILLEKLRSPGEVPDAVVPIALARFGLAETAVPALVEALKIPDAEFRESVMDSLAEIGPPAREAVPCLVRFLKDPEESIRIASLKAILAIGPGDSGRIEGLEDALADRAVEVRILAAALHARQEPRRRARTIQGIVDGLFYEAESIREASERALRFLGRDARNAVPSLLRRALGQDSLHIELESALLHMGLEDGEIRVLISSLRGSQEKPRRNAAFLLRGIGPRAKEAVPALIEAMKDRDERIRLWAIQGLGAMGPAAKDAVRPLRDLARSRRKTVRDLAKAALGKIEGEELPKDR